MKIINWFKTKYAIIIPFLIIASVYFGFMAFIICKAKETDSLGLLGSFGDSFGTLNTLFSGLGFSGLLITLFYQQRQINNQEQELKKQEKISSLLQYEATLHKLITLYQNTMKEVKITYEGSELIGRDALQKSLSIFNDKIKDSGLTAIPILLHKRYKKNELTEDDKELLNYFYYKHFVFLNNALSKQWRLTESFKILLRHLETSHPDNSNIQQYRDLVFSQLTYVECTYIFLIALGGKDNSELRKHIISSSMFKSFSHIKLSEIQKIMFKEFWGMDLSKTESRRAFPINKNTIKHIKIKEKEIQKRLENIRGGIKIKTKGSESHEDKNKRIIKNNEDEDSLTANLN